MGASDSFLARWVAGVPRHLEQMGQREAGSLESAAALLADAWQRGHRLFGFGCNHSGLLVDDLFYRAATPVFMNPIHVPGLRLDGATPEYGSALERLGGLADRVLDHLACRPGDVLLVVSTSGQNPVPVEMAQGARARGLQVVALTSCAAAAGQDGPSVADFATVVLDNGVPPGDGTIPLPDAPGVLLGPVSTIAGAFLLHAWFIRTVERLQAAGVTAPVLMSGNRPGGPEYNREVLAEISPQVLWARP